MSILKTDQVRNFLFQIYILPDGTSIHLLLREAAEDATNTHVTWLIDVLFKPKELTSIPPQDVPLDHRYQLLKGKFSHVSPASHVFSFLHLDAVHQKFPLHLDELDRIWPWLHTVILAKRRMLIGKDKKQALSDQADSRTD